MISKLDRKILTKACGVDLYYPNPLDIRHMILKHSYTTPDDWELVRMKVVVPHITINPSSFSNWICMRYSEYFDDSTEWILTMAPAECCQMVADFIKESPDLFPWVVDFIAEIAEKKMPTGSAQIASGKGMPWVEEMMEGKG